MSKAVFVLIIATLMLALQPARAAGPTELSIADFGATADSGADATPAFAAAIAEARRHPDGVVLHLPKGRYDLFPEKASHRTFYASNACDGDCTHTIAIDIRGLKNLTIDGQGSVLMMRGKMTLLVAEECDNFALKNLTFDFLRPTMSEIKVTEVGADYWIGQVHRDSKYQLKDGKLLWIGEGWQARHNLVQAFDPSQNITWRMGSDPLYDATAISELKPGLLRFALTRNLGDVKVGYVLQCRDVKRDEVGMWLVHSKNVRLADVTVRYMHGFGILGQFTENITIDRVVVAPSRESGRTCAAFADVLHFSMCRGKILVRDSVLSAAHDDAINVHGVYFQVIAHPAPNQILVRFPHGQTYGFQGFFPGDAIAYTRKKSLENFGESKVVAVEVKDLHQQLLTLADPMPESLVLNDDCIENTTWTPSLEARNCDVSIIPTRGFLITTRRPVLVENSRFFRMPGAAIDISNDAQGWFESGPIRDVTIRGNKFILGGEPTIRVDNANHSGLKILDNDFILQDHLALSALHVKGVTFAGNNCQCANPPTRESDLTTCDGSTDVVVNNNTITKRVAR